MPDEYVGEIIAAAIDIGGAFAEQNGGSAEDAFKDVYTYVNIDYDALCANCHNIAACGSQMSGTVRYDGRDVNCTPGGAFTPDAHNITIATLSNAGTFNMVHEFGHAYDHLLGHQPRSNMPPWMYSVGTGRDLFLRPNPCDYCYVWQQHPPSFGSDAYGPSETFGDLFIAWVYDAWNTSTDPQNVTAVINAQQWMNNGMSRNLWMP